MNLGRALLANFSAGDNEHIRILLGGAGFLALAGGFAPQGLGASRASTLAALTSTIWMVHWVHG